MSTQGELTTPVALLIFNRPNLTRRVFDQVRHARPRQLFVVGDGPRPDRPADVELCAQARAVIDAVDWPCEVRTDFSTENLGCGKRIASGLNWVFSEAEEAIILEDDCVPTASFFGFCQALLDYYRDDTRVVHIGGNNFEDGICRTPYSYFFSKYNPFLGWATWRRAWKLFDHGLSTWPEIKAAGWLRFVCEDEFELLYWTRIFDWMHDEKPNVWGYAWTYACFLNGLSVYPSVNLVAHVGGGPDATNTKTRRWDNLPTEDIWEITHPPVVVCHREADRYTFDHVFDGLRQRRMAAERQDGRNILARGMRRLLSRLAPRPG